MKISGAAIIRNGVKLGFPFIESIRSVLPLCDEFIIAVGDSEDGTRRKVEEIDDPKIRIIDTVWDMSSRRGGEVLSVQTNLAMKECSGDWIFYIQSDEAVHEQDYAAIRSALTAADGRPGIDGLAFDYHHFYGSYSVVQAGRNWYRKEVRLVRNGTGIVSHGDAQGFRKNGKKLRAVACGAHVYHYGWARPPAVMVEKIKSFHKLWHDDAWIEQVCSSPELESYFPDLGNLAPFTGTHPRVMAQLIRGDSASFIERCRENYRERRTLKQALKDLSRRLPFGEHRNFTLVR